MNLNLNLNQREKLAVGGGIVFLAVFFLLQWIVFPVFEKREALRRQVTEKQEMLLDMQLLRAEYLDLKDKMDASRQGLQNRPANFTLFSFLDQLAGDTNLKEHIAYMKPSTAVKEDSGLKISRVELKLQDVTMKDLTAYLFKVETSPNLVMVKRLSINRTGKDSGLVTAVIQAETFES
jgi:general secretion pathway protein M